jgi:hypothetical protein
MKSSFVLCKTNSKVVYDSTTSHTQFTFFFFFFFLMYYSQLGLFFDLTLQFFIFHLLISVYPSISPVHSLLVLRTTCVPSKSLSNVY